MQDPSTEEKIKKAARELFHQKGYEGTKTRDIAKAAEINLALMNYYFRSKKKLFEIIMLETIELFFQSVFDILSDDNTDLKVKIRKLTTHYIDMLQEEPEMPIFILSEIRNDATSFMNKIFKGKSIENATFFQNLNHSNLQNGEGSIHPAQLLLNFISMIVFPFAAKPMIMELFSLDEPQFGTLMEDRKELIPTWMNQLISPALADKSKNHD